MPSSGGYIPGRNFRPIAAANYHGNELHGPRIVWWPSGLRRSMESYNVGVPMGIWAKWSEEGVLLEQRNYFDSTARLPAGCAGRPACRMAGAGGARHLGVWHDAPAHRVL